MTEVRLDLAASAGGGDGRPDTVTIDGTAGADAVGVAGEGGGIRVAGLRPACTSPTRSRPATSWSSTPSAATTPSTRRRGSRRHRARDERRSRASIRSSAARGTTVQGGDGNDFAFMGAGDDTFVWSPGDDNDTIEGEERLRHPALQRRRRRRGHRDLRQRSAARFFRNIASVTDRPGRRRSDRLPRHGRRRPHRREGRHGDRSRRSAPRARPLAGIGDGQPDGIIVDGTPGDDTALIVGDASGVAARASAPRSTSPAPRTRPTR